MLTFQRPTSRFTTSNDYGWTPLSAEQKSQHTLARQSQEALALNSPRYFPLRRTSCVPPVSPQIPLEAFFNDGGGSLRPDKYHTKKVCQGGKIQTTEAGSRKASGHRIENAPLSEYQRFQSS